METEWDYSGRKGRDGRKKKIGKANEKRKKEKVKKQKMERMDKGGKKAEKGIPRPHAGSIKGKTEVTVFNVKICQHGIE